MICQWVFANYILVILASTLTSDKTWKNGSDSTCGHMFLRPRNFHRIIQLLQRFFGFKRMLARLLNAEKLDREPTNVDMNSLDRFLLVHDYLLWQMD
jgi:hypothetical protein